MNDGQFVIVDVFTQGPFTGNPLAVFLNGESYTSAQMQVLARELNFSETTFLLARASDGSFPVRIFTPVAELPFAGHPALGSAFVIARQWLQAPVEQLDLRLGVGLVRIDLTYRDDEIDIITMTQPQPSFGAILPSAQVARMLGLDERDVLVETPVQMVSTGLPFLIVPVRDLGACHRAQLAADRMAGVPGLDPGTNVLVFCRDGQDADHDLHVRVFVPELGISEDPATGSANGCLCAYLLHYHGTGPISTPANAAHPTTPTGSVSGKWVAEQGYEIGRRSCLYLEGSYEWSEATARYTVRVGGRVALVASAQLCAAW